MPIMDGNTSTKEIRSFENSSSSDGTSPADSLPSKNRVPIIAVSATLVERERDFYIDVGFDGWILKPIPFDRLRHIMSGVADSAARKEDLYKPGCWERGGWFKEASEDVSTEQGLGEKGEG
jgi:CheY-like chemotaxis protein